MECFSARRLVQVQSHHSVSAGRQRAFAFEQQPISMLETLCPAGLKVGMQFL